MFRRDLLNTAFAAGAASLFASDSLESADRPSRPAEIIDSNVSLFHWPFRRVPLDETRGLVDKLRALGVSQAWAGSFEGILQRDISAVNERLVEACRPYVELRPAGSINPELPGWEEDLRRCSDQHQMRVVRLHPNYHGYTLADSRFRRLLEQASAAGMMVQVAAAMEDTRTQHPLMQVADVDLSPLPAVMREMPQARVQILNARLRGTLLDQLSRTPGVYFDTARVEGTDGVANLLRGIPVGRGLFGSHAPLLIPEASLIRVSESMLNADELRRLMYENANAVLG